MTEYAFVSKYHSKNVQVVRQVVNNKKVISKTPREANLYGNWCVRKGLNNLETFAFHTRSFPLFLFLVSQTENVPSFIVSPSLLLSLFLTASVS